jgi:oligopeptide/dipeptide ABC transporter ATP-binding protein
MTTTEKIPAQNSTENPDCDAVLAVHGLTTVFHTGGGTAQAVTDLSFQLSRGRTLALVGESGCGKSVSALSIMRLIPRPPGEITAGEIRFRGKNLLELPEKAMRRIRGNDISMIFQEPMTAMNPVFRIGSQISAVIRLHRGLSKQAAREETIALLDRAGIPDPATRAGDYPHQLSGGMLQRVMIAMALACGPEVLVADEPTTALDVTIQAQILALLNRLREETGMAVLLITHDLGVVAETADDVIVMYAGRKAEAAPVERLFAQPVHPYTQGLFASLPAMQEKGKRLHAIRGNVPAATDFPAGCPFHPRCPRVMDRCRRELPPFFEVATGHAAACWLHADCPVAAGPLTATGGI